MVAVDRLAVQVGLEALLVDTLETAAALADNIVHVKSADYAPDTLDGRIFACLVSSRIIDEIEPWLFSFNNPGWTYPDCSG